MKWLRQILTADKDSTVYDLVRVMTAAAFIVGVSLTVFTVLSRGKDFDIAAFGTGIGLIIGAGGGAMALRKDRE